MKNTTFLLGTLPRNSRLFLGGLAMVISMILSSFPAGARAQEEPQHMGPRGDGWSIGVPFKGHAFERLLDTVKATETQRNQINQIIKTTINDLKPLHDANQGLRQQARLLLTQNTIDANAAESLRQQMLANHDQVSKRWLRAILDISQILTAEQRQQLAQHLHHKHEVMQKHKRK